MNTDEKFEYIYCAPNEDERREIESIKRQYTVQTGKDDKLDKLRALNRRVMQPPLIIGLIVGIFGTLIMGLGMTMVLEWGVMGGGILIGVIGVACAACAYPLYKLILRRNKRRYGQRIIQLSNELLHGEESKTDSEI